MIRSRYRALNTIMSLASGFTGFLDTYTGAVVAYSPNRLSSLYSSTMFRTRRSSDNAEDDIGFGSDNLLDTTALEAFVNGGEVFTNPDITSATGWAIVSGTTYNASTEAFDVIGGAGLTVRQSASISGHTFTITIVVDRIDSGGFTIYAGGTQSAPINTAGTHTLTIVAGSSNTILAMNPGNACDCSVSSFSAIDTTADGAVSVYEDQVDSTYNKETSDFSVGTNLYTSVSRNDTLTRLDDFEGVNNVLKLEATTGATSVHQMRKNIGQGDHFRYLVSCKIYIPTTNTGITKVALYNGVDIYRVIDKATEGDQWVTLENEEYFGSANTRFFVAGLNDAEDFSFASTTGDKFYLADVVIDGNYDLSNRTSDEQPLIVDGGTTETDNFIDFDGSNDRLVTKAIDAFQGDFTIDLEVDFTDVTTRQAIFTNRTTTSDRFGLTVWNTHLYFDYYDGATYTGGRVASMTAGTYKITLTRENGGFTIYVNGASQTIASLGGLLGSTLDDQMTLGDYRNVTNPTFPYGGRVRTCIVYDSAQPEDHATAFNSLFS